MTDDQLAPPAANPTPSSPTAAPPPAAATPAKPKRTTQPSRDARKAERAALDRMIRVLTGPTPVVDTLSELLINKPLPRGHDDTVTDLDAARDLALAVRFGARDTLRLAAELLHIDQNLPAVKLGMRLYGTVLTAKPTARVWWRTLTVLGAANGPLSDDDETASEQLVDALTRFGDTERRHLADALAIAEIRVGL